MDLQHQLYRIALDDRLYLSPIPKDELYEVLDVGCGTGNWCIDMADTHPQAQVLGFDLRFVVFTNFASVTMLSLTSMAALYSHRCESGRVPALLSYVC